MELVELSLADLAMSQSLGPIAIGKNINEVGPVIGPPKYWGFGPGKEFSMIATFVDVEVHCRAVNDVVTIFYAEIRWSKFKKRTAAIYANIQTKLVIRIPDQPRKLTLRYLEAYFRERNIPFYSYPNEPVMHTTTGTIRFGEHLCFFFSGEEDPLLEVISLS